MFPVCNYLERRGGQLLTQSRVQLANAELKEHSKQMYGMYSAADRMRDKSLEL